MPNRVRLCTSRLANSTVFPTRSRRVSSRFIHAATRASPTSDIRTQTQTATRTLTLTLTRTRTPLSTQTPDAHAPRPRTAPPRSIWKSFVPFHSYQVFQRGAYFAVEVVPDALAVVSLNTMYFYDANKGACCPVFRVLSRSHCVC